MWRDAEGSQRGVDWVSYANGTSVGDVSHVSADLMVIKSLLTPFESTLTTQQ